MTFQEYLDDHQNAEGSEDEGPDEKMLWREWVDIVTEEGDER